MTAWRETSSADEATASLPELLETLLAAVLALQEADLGIIHLYDARDATLRVVAQHGFDESLLRRFAQRGMTSLCRTVVQQREPVLIDDVTAEDAWCESLQPFAAAASFRALQCIPVFDRNGELRAVLSTLFRQPHRPSPRELHLTDLLARQAGNVISCRITQESLRRTQEAMRQALDAAEIGVWSWDPVHDVAHGDAVALRLLGLPVGTAFSFSTTPDRYLHPGDVDGYRLAMAAALDPRGNGELHVDLRWRQPDGSQRWLQQCGRTEFEGDGAARRAVRMDGTLADITELKRAEERHALLTRELDHRARNLLASVQAMISLSIGSRADLGELAATLNDRLVSLVRAYTLSDAACASGASLKNLLTQQLRPYIDGRPGTAAFDGPDVQLEPGAITAFSMVIHELVTNAAKHGALSVGGGRISVTWWEQADGRVCVEWKESGGPQVEPPRRRGFGSQLLSRTLELHVGAGTSLEFEQDGVRCRMTFPIARRSPAPPARPAQK